MPFLHGITLLLVFQLVGEVLVHLARLPLPGPVLGMALLFVALILRRGLPDALNGAASNLLGHLSLLFVPAGVGVMLHFDKLADDWLAIGLALLLGSLITLGLTALLMQWLLRWQR
ncbi:CidA/LrgA family protein [Magnetovirga frankeli]|uniref:CidA/LrgA family protein n=1 Tax=Magnetovirga frankeli TaxID=947516 RepID=UPI001293C6AF|nr:CidA/LrgA family protein [gamma proteobacterium SS-5]